VPDAGRILLRNVYGWFERAAPGLYRLTGAGEAALGGPSDGELNGIVATHRHGVSP
jgi:hypothetical protein